MEVLLLILIIILLFLVVNAKNSTRDKLDTLNAKLEKISTALVKIQNKEELPLHSKSILEDIVSTHKTAPIKPEIIIQEEEVEEEEDEAEETVAESKEEVYRENIESPPVFVRPEPIPVRLPVNLPPAAPVYKPGFFERNPDLEKFIGENLANKIGIGILVLGIGFFVKYAIDQEWINEIGRVFIGILCGGILLGVAHKLRKTFTAFSSVLVGGGIAVLYLTIAIAFHEYKIFDQTPAFLLMLGITSFAVVLSLGYNRIELAVLSILGGFASPFMVSTGEGNYVVLFTYILILDSGMLVLAYYKKWNLVNIICYVFTILLFSSWLTTRFDDKDVSMINGALIFATLFYLVFFAMNIVNNLKERTSFKAIEISILLSNTFCYYAAGMMILNNEIAHDFKGLFTASLGIFNFVFAYLLYKNSRVDKNLVFLLIGLVLTFISLAAPVQLEGNYITLFWAAETVLLLWLSQKSGIRLMKLASLFVMVLMVISLTMDWEQIYFSDTDIDLPIVLNKGYITSLFALASILITGLLLKNERQVEDQESVKLYKVLLTLGGIILLYASQFLELRHQLFEQGIDYTTQNIIIGTYNMAFIIGLLIAEWKFFNDTFIKTAFSFWGTIAAVSYLLYYHREVISSRNDLLLSNGSSTGFIFHYILISLLIVIAIASVKKMRSLVEFNTQTHSAYAWFYVFFFVFLASAELDHTVLLITGPIEIASMEHLLSQNHKIGYPILWGIASFILIFVGLKRKNKHLRIISLSLFLITLIKLFTFDIKGISEGGKIAAFISLGILLLIVSFMYQRLKKLLLADEPANSIPENENPV
jgi:hypothetical protein